ncbi:hypothetical protein MMC07_003913 [Pseudocyphellaria aurata]|nr:hypothetical protein [Pseudocyphellaria aurata]
MIKWCFENGAQVSDGAEDRDPLRCSPVTEFFAASSTVFSFELIRAHGAQISQKTLHKAVEGAATYARADKPKRMAMMKYLVEVEGLNVNGLDTDERRANHFGTPIAYAATARGGVAVDLSLWFSICSRRARTRGPTAKRAMIDTGDPESGHLPQYRVTPLRREIQQPSFGDLHILPLELLFMVFEHLTCDDLEALHSCSTAGRMAVLAFPPYHNLLQHSPTILSVLKKTTLARAFTIKQIYETFTSSLCTTCDQFGGFVFLPSFARCCLFCAETRLKFLPISRAGAKLEFGIKGKKIFESLPQLNNIQGSYSSSHPKIKHYTQRLTLYSRELVEKLRDPNYPNYFIRREGDSIKVFQRYMALTPLPCFIPKSASLEKGVCCAGCDLFAKEHARFCMGTDLRMYRNYISTLDRITDGDFFCPGTGPGHQCPAVTEHFRLYDSRQIISHLKSCDSAKALLRAKWTLSQKKKALKGSKKSHPVDVHNS